MTFLVVDQVGLSRVGATGLPLSIQAVSADELELSARVTQ